MGQDNYWLAKTVQQSMSILWYHWKITQFTVSSISSRSTFHVICLLWYFVWPPHLHLLSLAFRFSVWKYHFLSTYSTTRFCRCGELKQFPSTWEARWLWLVWLQRLASLKDSGMPSTGVGDGWYAKSQAIQHSLSPITAILSPENKEDPLHLWAFGIIFTWHFNQRNLAKVSPMSKATSFRTAVSSHEVAHSFLQTSIQLVVW